MKNYFIIVFVSLLPIVSMGQPEKKFPKDYTPAAWVNDYAGILPAGEENALNSKLAAYEDSTSTQILVVTLTRELHNDMPIDLMGADIGEEWNIGQKGNDNGMIIVIYPEEREVAIQNGYGLEQFIPDAISKRIIENEILPNFRNQEYFEGLDLATNVIFSLLSGEFTAEQYAQQTGGSAAPFGFLIILVLFFIFFGQSRRNRAHGIGKDLPLWMALTMLSGSNNRHRGSFGNFNSGSGSFGGFGGFGGGGGGSFGGGGARGSW